MPFIAYRHLIWGDCPFINSVNPHHTCTHSRNKWGIWEAPSHIDHIWPYLTIWREIKTFHIKKYIRHSGKFVGNVNIFPGTLHFFQPCLYLCLWLSPQIRLLQAGQLFSLTIDLHCKVIAALFFTPFCRLVWGRCHAYTSVFGAFMRLNLKMWLQELFTHPHLHYASLLYPYTHRLSYPIHLSLCCDVRRRINQW